MLSLLVALRRGMFGAEAVGLMAGERSFQQLM